MINHRYILWVKQMERPFNENKLSCHWRHCSNEEHICTQNYVLQVEYFPITYVYVGVKS